MRKTLVACVLLPTLLTGQPGQLSDSLRTLLRKPVIGPAQLTFVDGTHTNGTILRVTDQYVSFTDSPRTASSCRNIELTRIARVKSSGNHGEGAYLGLVPIVLPGVALSAIITGHAARGLPSGSWESVAADPTGQINHLEFHDVTMRALDVLPKQGRYRLEDGLLHLNYEGEAEEVVPVHFECEALVAERPGGPLAFRTRTEDRAYAPIVGLWRMQGRGDRAVWDLRPDGTFRIEKIDHDLAGGMQRVKGGIRVNWSGEEWQIRHERDRLFVTKGGVAVEYKRSAPVR